MSVVVSIIVPTYKDLEALKLIIQALELQSYKDFEVIIAEDDDSTEVKNYLAQLHTSYNIKHFSQEDKGWRKARALNGAIQIADGDYLIFFDGDCLPYSTFVEHHVYLSAKNRVLCGRRVNLGDSISEALRHGKETVQDIETKFFRKWLTFKNDETRHLEQGIDLLSLWFFPAFLYPLIAGKTRLVGCNFSVYKEKMLAINGFDESYPTGDVADDVDVEWRLNAIGVENWSCKYAANLLHLNHKRADRQERHNKNYSLMLDKQRSNEYRCMNGIEKL